MGGGLLVVAGIALATVLLVGGDDGDGDPDGTVPAAATADPATEAPDPAADGTWATFTDPDGRFRADLPGVPVRHDGARLHPEVEPATTWRVDLTPGKGVLIGSVPMAPDLRDLPPEEWMDEQALLLAGDGPEVEVTDHEVAGWPAKTFRPIDPGIHVRVTVVGFTGYSLLVSTVLDGDPEPTHQRVLASIDITA